MAFFDGAVREHVALTFDDGPDPRGTPAVLEALAAAGVRATFFVLGERAEREPALLARTLAEGHVVEVHGHAHLRHTEHPREAVEADLRRALKTLGDVRPTGWRLPWGDLAPYSRALAAEHGLTLVGWTTDTHDWRGDAAELMLDSVALEPGAVVLMHDGIGPGARRSDCTQTARLVGPLVGRIRERGLEPGGIPSNAPVGNPDFAS
jgi:peptidoglycan/xylan/chitin deacetylase (PgdA/CDA1 family)